jgi:beta-mannosidase
MKNKLFLITWVLSLICFPAFTQSSGRNVTEIKSNWKMHKFGNNLWYNATVPGCVHTDLIANKLIPDPFYRENEKKLQWIDKYSWEYATDFIIDKSTFEKQNLELNFKGLDTYADVYVNENLVLSADNMFIDWRTDVKKVVKEGSNKLRILFHSPVVMGLLHRDQWNIEAPMGFNMDFGPTASSMSGSPSDLPSVIPYVRKAAYMFGWDWAPSLATSGIWRPVYLEAWDNARISSLQVVQKQVTSKKADLTVMVEIEASAVQDANITVNFGTGSALKNLNPVKAHLKPGVNIVPIEISIEKPSLWWPNGMGTHPVYEFTASLTDNNHELDRLSSKTGLRTVRLVADPDKFGQSFYFEINGIPVFAKGADYVPSDIFPSRTSSEHYTTLIRSAADANINMLRVWGGGIYESDYFYDLCDENGIMIWQDFAFAIYITPNDETFMNSIKHELTDNIKRLRNHPSIVLWCGNNETEIIWDMLEKRFFGLKEDASLMPALTNLLKLVPVTPVKKETTEAVLKAYDDIYRILMPETLKQLDLNKRPYRSSSPNGGWKEPLSTTQGDMHYYIAYMNARFEEYYSVKARFFSEHGFQSFPDFNTVKKFTTTEDWNYLSPVMQHHQRAMGGNQVLDKYMKMYYHYPKDFESYLYVSQVMQADVMQMSFETHRKSRPYTMGTLYWQLNDVWPVASWSSMDYLNNWKALHYQVKRSFANVILAPEYYHDSFSLYLISDSLKSLKANAEIRIMDFNGKELRKLNVPVSMEANSSKLILEKTGKEITAGIDTTNAVCIMRLTQGKKVLTTNYCYFAVAKNLNLPKAVITKKITPTSTGYTVELSSDKYARYVFLSIDKQGFFSDNYFNLMPEEKKTITFTTAQKPADFEKDLKVMSLVDTY